VFDFIPLQSGQALQAHFQNGLSLSLRKYITFQHRIFLGGGFVDQKSKLLHELFPVLNESPFHELLAGIIRGWGGTNQVNDLIDIVQGYQQTNQDMGPLQGFAQIKAGAADNHLQPELDKLLNDIFQVEGHRSAPH